MCANEPPKSATVSRPGGRPLSPFAHLAFSGRCEEEDRMEPREGRRGFTYRRVGMIEGELPGPRSVTSRVGNAARRCGALHTRAHFGRPTGVPPSSLIPEGAWLAFRD